MTREILLEQRDGIALVTIDRPQVRNALTIAMCRELIGLFERLATDADARVVVLRGSGGHFCSGADLRDAPFSLPADAAARGQTMAEQVRTLSWPLFLALGRLPQPVIASVAGHAVGAGAQFALSADLVVAGRSAKFTIPQVNLGHSADHGESWYLPRKVGAARAMQILLLGEALPADDAERYGLVNWVVDDPALEERTVEIASRLARGATTALRETKALVQRSLGSSLQEQLEAEARAVGRCAATSDFVEAIDAFMGKRAPAFTGR
jgi:2-(1,2-epoxy-1,2-dihydrophenyl)acetyl-CoA isomerase